MVNERLRPPRRADQGFRILLPIAKIRGECGATAEHFFQRFSLGSSHTRRGQAAAWDGVMGFLLRIAFWLSIVVVLLPAPAAKKADPEHPQVSTMETLGVAVTALQDARSFCDRNPGACEVGSHALHTFGQKAQYGAKMLYDFLSERFADDTAREAKDAQPGRHTLTPADLAPAWNGPAPVPLPPRRPA
jgi:hypothetical protein